MHVVVGTPGRVYDMLRRRALRADSIKVGANISLLCGDNGRVVLSSVGQLRVRWHNRCGDSKKGCEAGEALLSLQLY